MMTLLNGLGAYLKRVLIALSVLLNVVLGGDNNQTFSARNYHWHKNGKPNLVPVIDMLLGKNHCMFCWVYWKARKAW